MIQAERGCGFCQDGGQRRHETAECNQKDAQGNADSFTFEQTQKDKRCEDVQLKIGSGKPNLTGTLFVRKKKVLVWQLTNRVMHSNDGYNRLPFREATECCSRR